MTEYRAAKVLDTVEKVGLGTGRAFWSGDESTNASDVSDVGVANTE